MYINGTKICFIQKKIQVFLFNMKCYCTIEEKKVNREKPHAQNLHRIERKKADGQTDIHF